MKLYIKINIVLMTDAKYLFVSRWWHISQLVGKQRETHSVATQPEHNLQTHCCEMITTCNFIHETLLMVIPGKGYSISCVWLISGSLVTTCSVT